METELSEAKWVCHYLDAHEEKRENKAEETAGQIVAWRGEERMLDVDGWERGGQKRQP
jgi:hypothetical protein